MVIDLVSFALLLTVCILAVICGILAFERIWLMKKNDKSRSENFRVGISRY